MFATTNKLLLDYLRVVIDGGTIPTANDRRDLAIELHEIIIGLDFIIERVIKLEKKITVLSELREATTPSFESSKEKHARVEIGRASCRERV